MQARVREPQIESGIEISLKDCVDRTVQSLLHELPALDKLSSEQRRRIIARYTIVLEGNFIAWMTATYLRSTSKEAAAIIVANLREEIEDDHPGMLRRFAIAAGAAPNMEDYLAVSANLQRVRQFIAKQSGLKLIVTMLFFETFIANFMNFLAELAVAQGSRELVYTDVHGLVDIAHSEAMFSAAMSERDSAMVVASHISQDELLEGVFLLADLLRSVFKLDDRAIVVDA